MTKYHRFSNVQSKNGQLFFEKRLLDFYETFFSEMVHFDIQL